MTCTKCGTELEFVIIHIDKKQYCAECGVPILIELEKLEETNDNR